MLATVLFVSVFNTGHGERGLVAGSGRLLDPLTSQALEVIIAGAFGTVSERSAFDALRERLVAGRDGLIAHVDGSKVDMKHTPQLTSFRTASSAFDWSDARPLFDAVNALSLSARGFRAALDRRSSPGEAETNAAG